MARSKGAKRTKNGRVFVTCTLSPDGYKKMRELMECIGATSQGQVLEQSIHRWYSEEPLIQNKDKSKEEEDKKPSQTATATPSNLSTLLKNRNKGKKECQTQPIRKVDSGKELDVG